MDSESKSVLQDSVSNSLPLWYVCNSPNTWQLQSRHCRAWVLKSVLTLPPINHCTLASLFIVLFFGGSILGLFMRHRVWGQRGIACFVGLLAITVAVVQELSVDECIVKWHKPVIQDIAQEQGCRCQRNTHCSLLPMTCKCLGSFKWKFLNVYSHNVWHNVWWCDVLHSPNEHVPISCTTQCRPCTWEIAWVQHPVSLTFLYLRIRAPPTSAPSCTVANRAKQWKLHTNKCAHWHASHKPATWHVRGSTCVILFLSI